MSYSFNNLSPADFEDLARDLIGREEGFRFEAFCAGPDGGIDGRHSAADGNVVLQAKHYVGSPFSKLTSAMKRERPSIDKLHPARYMLATTCKFTPASKASLVPLIGSSLKSQSDIFGPEDLNSLLLKYPEILKAHIKLWLSGTGVLERIVRAAAHVYAALTLEEIEQKVRVYASNPSFDQSLSLLAKHHLLIISGPPGVGKTTLAEILCYTFLSEDWNLVPIRSLDDGFAAIEDEKKQIFLFDDFLGRVALDRQALAHKDSELARFMTRIRRSKNARFILTTRGYIFEEARRISEHLGDDRLDATKYILDVGVYTRRIKARILYNHLLVSETPRDYIESLIHSKTIAEIVDHPNYNPRVIEAMTDSLRIREIDSANYPAAFIEVLKNPRQIWDTAFRAHIDDRCRHFLFALFFLSEYGASVADLRTTYEPLHAAMGTAYGKAHDPKDFEEALRILEGSFVRIEGRTVSFVNPSLKDYLSSYLRDTALLVHLAPTATSVHWISRLWDFVCEMKLPEHEQKLIANSCTGLVKMIETRPHWRATPGRPYSFEYNDTANSRRIHMLLDWWQHTNDTRFANSAISLARNPPDRFEGWSDGVTLIDLYSRLQEMDTIRTFIYKTDLLNIIENTILEIIERSSADLLVSLIDAVDDSKADWPKIIISALQDAVQAEFSDNLSRVREYDSTSSLSERIDELKKFALRFGIHKNVLNQAISEIESQIADIEEESRPPPSSKYSTVRTSEQEVFDDNALRDLFIPLLDR